VNLVYVVILMIRILQNIQALLCGKQLHVFILDSRRQYIDTMSIVEL